jgi:hypothetical protein
MVPRRRRSASVSQNIGCNPPEGVSSQLRFGRVAPGHSFSLRQRAGTSRTSLESPFPQNPRYRTWCDRSWNETLSRGGRLQRTAWSRACGQSFVAAEHHADSITVRVDVSRLTRENAAPCQVFWTPGSCSHLKSPTLCYGPAALSRVSGDTPVPRARIPSIWPLRPADRVPTPRPVAPSDPASGSLGTLRGLGGRGREVLRRVRDGGGCRSVASFCASRGL